MCLKYVQKNILSRVLSIDETWVVERDAPIKKQIASRKSWVGFL